MPELRIVVLATHEKLAYGQNFSEAMTNLFGEAATQAAPGQTSSSASGQAGSSSQTGPSGQSQSTQPGSTPSATPPQNLQQLIDRAIQEFDDYQRLTAQGKLGEAGQKLEQHRRTLEEIRKLSKP
jgi:uncharacterized membrane protein (UPF0182 family)